MAKNFDTGFIKLDENIVKETYNKKKDKQKDENGEKKRTLFRRNRTDVFEFEDQDIRTVEIYLYPFKLGIQTKKVTFYQPDIGYLDIQRR